ncbi:MAG: MFS transporter, partial [Ilumatobacteraceae bacterium]
MSSRERTLHHSWPAGSPEAQHALTPRADLVEEASPAGEGATTTFTQREGPFTDYQRTVTTSAAGVDETTRYRIVIPWFGWLFALPVRATLRHRPHDNAMPWWSPPDRLTQRNVATLGLLAAASMAAAFANTLFTQTASFAADGFGIDERGQGVGGVVVRLGVVIAIPFALLADRRGRRQMIVITAWVAPLWCALGAVAPNFWVLVGTQTIGRPVGLALALLIGVVAAEEMPRSSRAYALSVLALAGGLGAGVAVAALRLADLGLDGWRLVYLLSLIWLLPAYSLTRHLPETHRFEQRHAMAPRLDRGRFAIISIVAISANLFVAPASFFQNRYLGDVRGYTGGGIALFTFCTATPASLGLIAGGRIAEVVGRRAVLAICMPLSTLLIVGTFTFGGSTMWLTTLAGGLLAGAAYPAFTVYRTELFPTGNRGRANGYITALSLAGSSAGLLLVGALVHRGWSYGQSMLVVGVGQLIAALLAYIAYPETAHLELEQINPQDA